MALQLFSHVCEIVSRYLSWVEAYFTFCTTGNVVRRPIYATLCYNRSPNVAGCASNSRDLGAQKEALKEVALLGTVFVQDVHVINTTNLGCTWWLCYLR